MFTFVSELALAAVSAQAAPLLPKQSAIELGAVPSVELVVGGCGFGWHRHHWRDRWGYWHWAGAFRTEGLAVAGALGGTIPTHIGAVPLAVGVIHREQPADLSRKPVHS